MKKQTVTISASVLETKVAAYTQGVQSLDREIDQAEKNLERLRRDRQQTAGAVAAMNNLLKEAAEKTEREEKKVAEEAVAAPAAPVESTPSAEARS